MAVLLFALACGGGVPEAIHQPLLVMPSGARAVLIVDFIGSRGLSNFRELEDFLHNRDRDPAMRGLLPFDYQEFADHWRLDPLRNIDQLILGVYDNGWVAAMVGQFDPPHLISLARANRAVEGATQRGGTEENPEGYTVLHERTQGAPQAIRLLIDTINALVARIQYAGWQPVLTSLARSLDDTGRLVQAWPSEHIWLASSQPQLLNQALDLWDGAGGDHLLLDPAFSALYKSRPHRALVWVGLPATAGIPQPLDTLQIELDLRDFVTPKLILGYETPENTEGHYAAVDRFVQGLRSVLQRLPEEIAQNRVALDPDTAAIDRLGLTPILVSAAERMRVQIFKQARVTEIQAPLTLTQFERLLAIICNALMRG